MTPWLIIIAFALAALCSLGNVSLLALGLAILAYNAGMAATFLIAGRGTALRGIDTPDPRCQSWKPAVLSPAGLV
ncbi:hypothetical protein LP421_19335 [Rhizobium sp. RCAM05350]|nr:hypothetical protein LP421_19335 [Rhizobium sp. RCAM05350]